MVGIVYFECCSLLMFGTVNLSQFTRLKRFTSSIYPSLPVDELTASLSSVLSTITSPQFEEIIFSASNVFGPDRSLDSILTALAGLKDVNDILSRPQFHRLRSIIFYSELLIQVNLLASTLSLPHP